MENINDIIPHLANLAAATSDYETHWRLLAVASSGDVRREAGELMREASENQQNAHEALVKAGLDRALVRAIEGALIVAAARPRGSRRECHRVVGLHGSNQSVADFIREFVEV